MTGTSFSLQNSAAELGRGSGMALLGDTVVECADYGNSNISPYGVEGWFTPGYCTGGLDGSYTGEVLNILTGAPETSKGNIITAQGLEFTLTFSMPTYLGYQLAQGGNLAITHTVASDGQTTLSSGTTTTGTVASATGLAVGDTVIIEMDHGASASYCTGMKCLSVITAISGTSVTFTAIDHAPASGADFLKLKGWAAVAEAGILSYMGGANPIKKHLRFRTNLVNNKGVMIHYFHEVEFIQPTPFVLNDRKNLISFGITARVIPQYTSVTDLNGVAATVPIIGHRRLLPYES